MLRCRQQIAIVGPLLAATALVGCANDAQIAALERANVAIAATRRDPAVRQYAPVAYERTEQAYRRLQAASEDDAGIMQIEHLAYLVEQRAAIAGLQAGAGADLAEIDVLKARRQEILLEAERRATSQAERHNQEAAQRAQSGQVAVQQAQQRTADLQTQLADLRAQQTDRGLVLTLGDSLFDVNGAALQPGGQDQVARIAAALQGQGNQLILVEGHTDSAGSDLANLDLSSRRAEAVRQGLIATGVPAEQIIARGFGESEPVATNDTAAGRQQNRRVEVVVQNASG